MKFLHCPVTLVFTSALLVTALVIDKDKTLQLRSPCLNDCNPEAAFIEKRHGSIATPPKESGGDGPGMGKRNTKRHGDIATPPKESGGDGPGMGKRNTKRHGDIATSPKESGAGRPSLPGMSKRGGPITHEKRKVESPGSLPYSKCLDCEDSKHNKRDGNLRSTKEKRKVTHEGQPPFTGNEKRKVESRDQPPYSKCLDCEDSKHNKRMVISEGAPPVGGPVEPHITKARNTENEKRKVTHEGQPPFTGNEKRKVESRDQPPYSTCLDCDSATGKKAGSRKGH
ncbi:hypothetical protein HYFRA_00010202 [Hymenoscyphus fraxineus]|uniref:Uncharacterized protein n=1 Tax=Hymenoscyphus fraxineus TaxID=746836 RepID=A0A9N9PSI9_9HELO|nr:hypothetical protein HYFRA_00010202 [Hymenoscyphus fraxineus]